MKNSRLFLAVLIFMAWPHETFPFWPPVQDVQISKTITPNGIGSSVGALTVNLAATDPVTGVVVPLVVNYPGSNDGVGDFTYYDAFTSQSNGVVTWEVTVSYSSAPVANSCEVNAAIYDPISHTWKRYSHMLTGAANDAQHGGDSWTWNALPTVKNGMVVWNEYIASWTVASPAPPVLATVEYAVYDPSLGHWVSGSQDYSNKDYPGGYTAPSISNFSFANGVLSWTAVNEGPVESATTYYNPINRAWQNTTPAAPIAYVEALPATTGNAPLPVWFFDMSVGATSRVLDYGDGTSSVTQSGRHVYNVPGSYTATQSISSTTGSATTTPITVTVNGTVGLGAGVAWNYQTETDVPVFSDGLIAGGNVSLGLNFAPPTGTNLTVVRNTSLGFIQGNFAGLAQGQPVVLNYGGVSYTFAANYYGGASGRDLVLQWAANGSSAWGADDFGQLGDSILLSKLAPVAVTQTGALAGKTVSAMNAGQYHCLALCLDGTVAAWGEGLNGQLGNNSSTNSSVPVAVVRTGVLAGKTVAAVSAGGGHSLVLCSDGTLAAWGGNSFGQLGNGGTVSSLVPVVVPQSGPLSGKTVIAVAAGGSHSLALCSDGTVVAWGFNNFGQLGNNSTASSSGPVAVVQSGALAGKTVIAIAAGPSHSLALCSDGTVVAWGYNLTGALGNNTTISSSVPVAVNVTSGMSALAGKTVSKISAGSSHSLALCSDGTIAAWGSNSAGQLGTVSSANSLVPVAVFRGGILAGKTVTAISAGGVHSLARCSDGTAVTWGYGAFGELGNNSTTASSVPVAVISNGALSGKAISSVSGGYYFSVALCSDGTMASWGDDSYRQLGIDIPANASTPGNVAENGAFSGRTIVAVAGGQWHSIALCADGTLAGWGANTAGQLGTSTGLATPSTPMSVIQNGALSGKWVVAVAAAENQTLALCSDGTVAAWGENIYGELGNNTTTGGATPVAVAQSGVLSGKTVAAVAAGAYHSLALCSDGTVAAWGLNGYGQLGNNSTTNSSVPVAVNTTAGLSALSGKTVVAISAGDYHSLALCSDGTVVTWGFNNLGQLGNSTIVNSSVPVNVTATGLLFNRSVTRVTAGNYHNLALCSDGTLVAWGGNIYGNLGNNSTANSSVPVLVVRSGGLSGKTITDLSAGNFNSLALCSDGTMAAWGLNASGELGNNSTTSSSVPVAVVQSGTLAGKTVVAVGGGRAYQLAIAALPPGPIVTTQAATSVTAAGATIGGTVSANNHGTTSVSFDYGPSLNYGTNITANPASLTGSNSAAVSAVLTGLIPGTLYHYRVNGANGVETMNGVDLTFATPSNVDHLANLALSGIVLNPAFNSGVTSYTASVPNTTASTTVTPAVFDSTEAVSINGSPVTPGHSSTPISLAIGSNTINIAVTAQDGSILNYTVAVVRNDVVIATQQGTQTDFTGQAATFSVSVSGTGPFTYQWYYNGTAISGATGSSYTIASASSANAGSYWVVIASAYGNTTSSHYTLTVSQSVPALPSWGFMILPGFLFLTVTRFLPRRSASA